MFTFKTTVKATLPDDTLLNLGTVEVKALTAEQAEKQALAKFDMTCRDVFGIIVEPKKLSVCTVRKFTVEV